MSDKAESPRRRRRQVSGLISRLDDLAHESDPTRGADTAKDKDVRAYLALTIAGMLVRDLAGWAIDHRYGVALAQIQAWPLYSALSDSHEHEKRGIDAIRASTTMLDPRTARVLLTDLLRPMHDGLLPAPLWMQVIEGLESCDFGEPTPIFQPTLRGAKRKYRALRLQLKGLGHVEFRRRCGLKKQFAQEQVATAYGVGSNAVRGWEYRLKTSLGEPMVSKSLFFAGLFASQFLEFRERSDDYRANAAQKLFSDEMLRLDGQAFKADISKRRDSATERLRSVANKRYAKHGDK